MIPQEAVDPDSLPLVPKFSTVADTCAFWNESSERSLKKLYDIVSANPNGFVCVCVVYFV